MRGLRNLIFPKFRIWKWSRKIMFEYTGNDFRVVSDDRIRMAPPPSDPVADYRNETGFWASVVDARGSVLYRRIMHTPSSFTGVEVFTNNRSETLYRFDSNAPSILVVIVPDLPMGTRLELFGSSRDAEGRATPAVRVASISLSDTGGKGDSRGRR